MQETLVLLGLPTRLSSVTMFSVWLFQSYSKAQMQNVEAQVVGDFWALEEEGCESSWKELSPCLFLKS